jgi:ketosteroid isomerase-like protein
VSDEGAHTTRALSDRTAIIDLFSGYADAIDRRDAARYRACFTDVVDIETPGTHLQASPAEEWAALALQAVGVFEGTQHVITNHRVTLEGDEADCIATLQAEHWKADGAVTVLGRYTARLRRTGTGWRIAALELTVDRTRMG